MKTLDRRQLKWIAICAMVCDHFAWGFVDFMTPLGQILHIIGRLTLPIMCFFVAEGYRHTSNIAEYIKRMLFFWGVTVIPFYLFFGELYGYRQNIIFDLSLGLMMLAVLENKGFLLWQKIGLGSLLILISIWIGGWVIMPILYILAFYYGKSFKQKVVWICGLTAALEVFLIVAIKLNEIWHFSHYDWPWYDKLYLLGFMLPLFFLKRYNGEKGKETEGRYFFYLFYPAHFLVLYFGKRLLEGCSTYQLYLWIHILSLLLCLGIFVRVMRARPSRGQAASLFMVMSSCIYIFGFIAEIISGDIGGYYAATVTQYFGECLLMLAFTFFISEMCHREIWPAVYALESVAGLVIMWMVLTTRENGIFYTSIGINREGDFPRLVLEYGWGFTAFVWYMVSICVGATLICLRESVRTRGMERKRIICTAAAVVCPWISNLIRATGITGGHEVPCIGIVGAVILVDTALIRYGYFDSITLAGENALNYGQEGIMVINNNHIITYFNEQMQEIFGELKLKRNAYENETLSDIFEGRLKEISLQDRIYEMRVEPLKEGGQLQGHMLWALDVTSHHKLLDQISDLAHKDSLTNVYNRSYFTQILEEYMKQGKGGSLLMMDLNHFKQVNDRFGHQVGDEVLKRLGEVLNTIEDGISCRIGGDEFCIFYKEAIDVKELEELVRRISEEFTAKTANEKYAGITEISYGIARILEEADRDFERLYSNADKALYVAKNRSKNNLYIL
ncbi:MAG: TraX family protein [Lachnospiraceae bacterium]